MPTQPYLLEPTPEYTTGETDDARRAEYLERLRAYLRDPDFRAIEGFPIAEDDAILALSDPPYYTACPNPFLPEILEAWQAEKTPIPDTLPPHVEEGPGMGVYHREPFASDVSEGKNNPIYNAHSYHTKVPHKAIMRYILHYTDPGDIVFDGFCGTGMTGVAAQLCGDRKAVESLGYHVDADGKIYDAPPDPKSKTCGEQSESIENPKSQLGARKAVLVDLSPAATFIAYNYNTPVDVRAFEREAQRILDEVEDECGWMYETWHPHCDDPNRVKGRINYTVWSDVFVCPECGKEFSYWEQTVDLTRSKVVKQFDCPNCRMRLTKRLAERAWQNEFDIFLKHVVKQAKRIPVLISYSVGKARYEKSPDAQDEVLLQKASQVQQYEFEPPLAAIKAGDKTSDPLNIGFTHIHHYYSIRCLRVLVRYIRLSQNYTYPQALRFLLTSSLERVSLRNGYRPQHRNNRSRELGGPLPGNLYIPTFSAEINPLRHLQTRSRAITRLYGKMGQVPDKNLISTQSASQIESISRNSIDYIFVDPPFGSNLMYSELNYATEAWLRVKTRNRSEAIINRTQRKDFQEYKSLMERCFSEMYRILKPARWITVEFHNSKNSVWNAIQEALSRAGFIVADVRSLGRNLGTLNQITSAGAVKQDLIISAYKPNGGLEENFRLHAGTEDGAWDFVRQHLAHLPIVVTRPLPSPNGRGAGGEVGEVEILAERQDYLLFDRMVAFHIQRGARVPLSAAAFYAGLRQRFVERDSMFFLPNQVPQYDRARLESASVAQLTYMVNDEKGALQWLRQQLDPSLGGEPQTYQDVQPTFLRALHQARHEALPELTALLEQNFLQEDDGTWRVPDPGRAADLEALRRKALLREFSAYAEPGGRKRLRTFRTEAVRAGFADAWQRQDYATIVRVAGRLPERVLQEDAELLMYYDNATLRVDQT